MEGGNSKGFMKLAKYIGVFGEANNEEGEKLAMTAPVFTNDIGQADKKVMEFVLPAEIKTGVHNPPVPKDKTLYLRTEQPHIYAVKKFTWKYTAQVG